MSDRLFGLENEYAFTLLRGAAPMDRKQALQTLYEQARARWPHLPGMSSGGIFLGNGARFYLDSGHPELTTPEVSSPAEACRYLLAGERLLAELARTLPLAKPKSAQAILSRSNVCYSSGATFGSHESYGHRADPSIMPRNLIPHLVSRVIYTGAGGFNNRAAGVEFVLSPRSLHLVREVSGDSTNNRAIVHSKDESLSGTGYHRLHLICGEALCAQIATWLKVGTTALVVAMTEAGLNPGATVQLKQPLTALRAIAGDPTLQSGVELETGSSLTALELQWHYLRMAEQHCAAGFMPAWAADVCKRWRHMLAQLENGPNAVGRTLDWAIKLALFKKFARAAGFAWESLAVWTQAIRPVHDAWQRVPQAQRKATLVEAFQATDEVHRVPAQLAKLLLAKHGLRPDDLESFLALRHKLFELDVRFGQFDEAGVFNVLDRAGVLAHRVLGMDNVEAAMTEPPRVGRARLRGECIRRFAATPGRYVCEWNGIWDNIDRRFLDLSDPFAEKENWNSFPRPTTAALTPATAPLHLHGVLEHYNRGEYEQAADKLRLAADMSPEVSQRIEYLRYFAWVQSRRGHPEGVAAMRIVAQRAAQQEPTLDTAADFLCCYRFHGLGPQFGAGLEEWTQRGLAHWERSGRPVTGPAATFLGHRGHMLMRAGRLDEAVQVLSQATDARFRAASLTRVAARNFADLGEAYRRAGQTDQARAALDTAEHMQNESGSSGDLADFTLTTRAKLETDSQQAIAILERVLAIQSEKRNRVGECRTRLLLARLGRSPARAELHRARVVEIRDQTPNLARCPLLGRILDHWELWASGAMLDGEPDQFWNI